MSSTIQSLGIARMSVRDRLRLMDEIWESIPEETIGAEQPEWVRRLLDERIAEADADPKGGIPWRKALDAGAGPKASGLGA